MSQSPQLIPAPPRKPGPLAKLRNSIEAKTDAMESTGVETGFEAPRRIGLMIAFLVFGVFGLWSVTAPLEGYAYAPGFIAVGSYKETIQHFEGGIVKEFKVRDGDVVEAGDVLLVLDSTQALSQLEIYTAQLNAYLAHEARLIAERDDADTIAWPEELADEGEALNERRAQQRIFDTRKASRDGEIAILEQRIAQLESSIEGQTALRDSKTMLANSFAEELKDVQSLLDRGFENKQRLRELERDHAIQVGEAAQLAADIAATEIRVGEARQEILQLQNEFQREVADELAKVRVELQASRERVTALRDIVARTEVRAPESGVVNGMQVHTIGGVIQPGEVIAEIVPQAEDDLIIESRIQITDIDRVAEGQEAMVRLSAFSSKSVPTLYGNVLSISADAMLDQATQARYYSVRIALKPESLEALEGMELVPGMPAEAFIATGSRTFLEYVMKPLSNAVARSINED